MHAWLHQSCNFALADIGSSKTTVKKLPTGCISLYIHVILNVALRDPFEPSQSRSRHAAGGGRVRQQYDCSRDYEVMRLRRSTSEPKVEKDRRNNEGRHRRSRRRRSLFDFENAMLWNPFLARWNDVCNEIFSYLLGAPRYAPTNRRASTLTGRRTTTSPPDPPSPSSGSPRLRPRTAAPPTPTWQREIQTRDAHLQNRNPTLRHLHIIAC